MWVGLSLGRSTPRIRGMVGGAPSALALLVARVAANDQELPVPADQLAVFADPLHARSNLHVRQTPTRGDTRYAWKRLFIAARRRPGNRAARDSAPRRQAVVEKEEGIRARLCARAPSQQQEAPSQILPNSPCSVRGVAQVCSAMPWLY